jgi:hypothetical protein
MFLVASKKALSLQMQTWIDESRKVHQVELKQWSENLENPKEEVAKKLNTKISYLMETTEEFLLLLTKANEITSDDPTPDEHKLVKDLKDMSKDIAYAYLYVDEASDWICEIKK